MNTPKSNLKLPLFVSVFVVFAVAAILIASPEPAEAHQPEGLRISQEPVEDYPCPYGHDSGCEVASSPPAPNPYQGATPDTPISPEIIGNFPLDDSFSLRAMRLLRAAGGLKQSSSDAVTGTDDTDDTGTVRAALISEITSLPWVSDGVDADEQITSDWLSYLHDHEPTLATSLIAMPFLQDHNPGDRAAIRSITYIAVDREDADFVTDTLAIAELADGGGLDNDEAKIVSTFALAYSYDLDIDIKDFAKQGTIEESTATGRYNNSITFCVIRISTEKTNSKIMAEAKDAVDHAEELMGAALPFDFVAVAVHDVPPAGANNSISISIDSKYDTDDETDRERYGVVAHEIGHYYWALTGREYDWLDEGAAQYVAAYAAKKKYDDGDLQIDFRPCPYYRTVEHLRADAPQSESSGFICNYSLGERLFINLGRSMTDSAFKTAFRKLHTDAATSSGQENGTDPGELLLRAFCSTCASNPINLGATGFTLARRYGERILTDRTATAGFVPSLGEPISTAMAGAHDQRYFGFAEIPANSTDPRRWVRLYFDNVTNPPDTVLVGVNQYHEAREPWSIRLQERRVYSLDKSAWFFVYLSDQNPRPTGHHWVSIFNETGQLIAEVEYQVMP